MSKKETALEALRQIADRQTVKSIKETLLTYILLGRVRDLIWGERNPRPRWRRTITILFAGALTGALMHLHEILSLLQ